MKEMSKNEKEEEVIIPVPVVFDRAQEKIVCEIMNDDEFEEADKAKEHHSKMMANSADSTKGIKINRATGGRNSFVSNILYRIPILGSLILKHKIKNGYFCADVIFKNQQAMRYVVSSDAQTLEIEKGKEVRFFNLQPVIENNERYIKREGGVPVITLYWEYPNPIPVKPLKADIIDLGLFGNEVLRQRSKAAAQPIRDFLDGTAGLIKRINFLVMANVAISAAILAKLFGYL